MRPYRINSAEDLKSILDYIGSNFKEFDTIETPSYTLPLTHELQEKVKIVFTPIAYLKMTALVDGFSSEIAWHGLVHRLGETHFEIYDILTYPQTVTDATVNTDQKKYNEWHESLPDEQFNDLRFQGHSHVNMAVSPSGTDLKNQRRLLSTLSSNAYYIFLIINKSRKWSCRIYDLEKNVCYDEKDCELIVDGNVQDIVQQAKDMLTTISYGSAYTSGYYSQYNTPTPKTTTVQSAAKTVAAGSETKAAKPAEDDVVFENSMGWQDKNGVFHYYDQEPAGKSKVLVPSATTPAISNPKSYFNSLTDDDDESDAEYLRRLYGMYD